MASSDKAYGAHDELPYREDFALRPRFPYDVSKAAADLIARSYWETYGLPVAVTRFANLYGGGDLNPSRLIPEVVSAAISGRPPIIRSDGSPERDFLYVEDAVAAYLLLAEALDGDGAAGQAFNAGAGRPHSVRELVELICRVAEAGQRPMDAIISATSRAARALGLGDRTGAVAPGLDADLIAVGGDPLRDITTLRRIPFVMRAGHVYRAP